MVEEALSDSVKQGLLDITLVSNVDMLPKSIRCMDALTQGFIGSTSLFTPIAALAKTHLDRILEEFHLGKTSNSSSMNGDDAALIDSLELNATRTRALHPYITRTVIIEWLHEGKEKRPQRSDNRESQKIGSHGRTASTPKRFQWSYKDKEVHSSSK